MSTNLNNASDVAHAFSQRLRANADYAERCKFTVANLSTMSVADCRALAGWIDDAAEFLDARGMQAAVARNVKLRALDLANLLRHAFDNGAAGGAWEDYDCTMLGAYHSVAEACGIPAECYAGSKPVEDTEAAATRTIGVNLIISIDPAVGPDETVNIVVMTQDEYECLAGETERLKNLLCLADETIMDLHGNFPLDRTNVRQIKFNDACKAIRAKTGEDFDERKRRAALANGGSDVS